MAADFDSADFDSASFDKQRLTRADKSEVAELQSILQRLNRTISLDEVVQQTTNNLRDFLQVDRVVLYYFWQAWEGRVAFESLSDEQYSILGSTGPDDCFNGEYARKYLQGRVSAIANIEKAAIAPCHRDFLREMQVQANLVVPILVAKEESVARSLWGLLVAHNCHSTKYWSATEVEQMQVGANRLANASSIKQTTSTVWGKEG